MATIRPCLAPLSRLSLNSGRPTSIYIPSRFLSATTASRAGQKPKMESKKEKSVGAKGQNPQKNLKKKKGAERKKRKPVTDYKQYDLKDMEQFTLCEAMRYGFQDSYNFVSTDSP